MRYLLAIVTLLLLSLPVQAARPDRGYQSRACGFDLDFNGVIGEASDCNVCDGTTTDVDGNAVSDDLRYVDCTSGTDSGSCTSGSPCETVDYALGVIGSPSANQIQAVCVKGTCSSSSERSISNVESGASGYYTRTASGSEEWDFQYPRYPLMVVGWDTDNDGEYPPYDTDETAVFDGNVTTNGSEWFDNNDEYRVEVAHLTVKDYGNDCPGEQVNIITPQDSGGTGPDHLYFHDIALTDNQSGCADGVGIAAWYADGITYHAFENLNITGQGGFFFYRGDATESTGASYVRWKNVTFTAGTTTHWGLAKVWNHWDHIDYIDNHISNTQLGIVVAQCTQDVVLRNNWFDNSKGMVAQVGDSSTCNTSPRPVDNLVIDGNEIRCSSTICSGDYTDAIRLADVDGSGADDEYLKDVTITNNFISTESGFEQYRGILIEHPMEGSGVTGGTISIIGNTFDGAFAQAAILVSNFAGSGTRVVSDWIVRNNLFSNMSIVDNTTGTLSDWSSTGNRWQTGDTTDQVAGAACSSGPAYISGGGDGDYHLASNDTCALDQGSDPGTGVVLCSDCVDWDLDEDSRPQGAGWDIGADEYAVAATGVMSIGGITVSGVTIE